MVFEPRKLSTLLLVMFICLIFIGKKCVHVKNVEKNEGATRVHGR